MTNINKIISKLFLGALLLALFVVLPNIVIADNDIQIDFFYSKTCPHCIAEGIFLDDIEIRYPDVKVNRYVTNDNPRELAERLKEVGGEIYLGVVPITFVNDKMFVGFDSAGGVGKKIEDAVKEYQLTQETKNEAIVGVDDPTLEKIKSGQYSLGVGAIALGLLDGVNVCSLGALILILGLVIKLRSRKKIIFFGGIFILTTAVAYGLLILLWHQLFVKLSAYLPAMKAIIGLIGIGGGIYFLKEFYRFKKYGPTCDSSGSSIVTGLTKKVEKIFETSANFWALSGGVLLFALIITIIEFPCSAVLPVMFAGVLAEAGLSTSSYLFYIALFVVFYMLDEIVIFAIASWKMTFWMSSPKFTTWITLAEGIILFALGAYYLISFF